MVRTFDEVVAWVEANASKSPHDKYDHRTTEQKAMWFLAYRLGEEMRESFDGDAWAQVVLDGMPPMTKEDAVRDLQEAIIEAEVEGFIDEIDLEPELKDFFQV